MLLFVPIGLQKVSVYGLISLSYLAMCPVHYHFNFPLIFIISITLVLCRISLSFISVNSKYCSSFALQGFLAKLK